MLKIMIIDDEPAILSYLNKFIKTQYPSLEIAGTYSDSVEAYEAFCTAPVDILLTDIHMPIMNGLSLIERLQKLSHFFVPIIISGFSEFSYAKTAMSLGVIHYLLKPIDFDELSQCLNSAIHKLLHNQQICNKTNFLQEDIELFFMDCLTGRLSSKDVLLSRFNELSLPFSLHESYGVLLRISIESLPTSFTYERETLPNIFENFIRSLYHPECLTTLLRTQKYFDFFIIRPNEQMPDFSILCKEIYAILGITISANCLLSFPTIEELAVPSKNDMKHAEIISSENFVNYTSESITDDTLKTDDANQERIRLVLMYIQEHYAEDLTRENVASMFYLSSAHFSRLFKQIVGTSFLDYLTEVRMQKAIILLNSNMKIQDIGKAVGYPSRNRFSINFRNYTSYTPAEYRRNVLKILK